VLGTGAVRRRGYGFPGQVLCVIGAEMKNGTLVVQCEIAYKFASELKCALTDCFRDFSGVRSSFAMCATNT